MKYLKLHENFTIGDHSYILVSSNKEWYMNNNRLSEADRINFRFKLKKMANLDLSELDRLKRLKIRFDSLKDCQDCLSDLKEMSVKLHKVGGGGAPNKSQLVAKKREFDRLYGSHTGIPPSKTVKGVLYDDDKFNEILNDLVPMRIFIGAFEDEDEIDYTNL